ncbi:unnamed protein product [Ilex paraguariensis]|uniref:Uncharacterized protein n=1 Tax=Ilex paraguariensis TaxID=185542 RepID=A0ABC8TFL2_9AQUA
MGETMRTQKQEQKEKRDEEQDEAYSAKFANFRMIGESFMRNIQIRMAMVNKTRNMLEGLVREGPFKWLIKNQSSFDEDLEEMGRSPTAGKNWLPELSTIANIVSSRTSFFALIASNAILSVHARQLSLSFIIASL